MRVTLLPKLFRFLLISVLSSTLIFTLFRIAFFKVFNDPNSVIAGSIFFKSFYIGLKFDMRLALLLHLPVLLFGWIGPIGIMNSKFGKRLWVGYLVFVQAAVIVIYFVDFGYYAYLQTRIDATVLRFLYNLRDSLFMIWQSYPVVWASLLFAFLMTGYGLLLNRIIKTIEKSSATGSFIWKKAIVTIVCVIIYVFGIYGKFSYYPLRWSDAFFSPHFFASAIALNPILYAFDTLKNRDSKYEIEEVKKYYDRIAAYAGVPHPDKDALNYIRKTEINHPKAIQPNIVLVFLESFAYYKTGISGNPFDSTPNFDALAKQSILFTRYYTPHGGTARSVFTAITGLPDVELIKTSSRNPLIVQQHTIINAFKGYEKYYFLGGSANWGEIRGLLSHNIPGLHVYEEGSYSSPRVDVWGISDLHLFEEANKVLAPVKDKPFFAIIQTSGNHQPFTIPDDNRGFKGLTADEDEVIKYGFRSVAALNSFRFMDHSIGFFIETAKKEGYFDNTIFVFFGDHGLHRNAMHMQKSEDQLLLGKHHVPLVIYAPWLITEGKSYDKVASSVDLLPTLASLIDLPYVNSAFGRDLLDDRFDDQRFAFTIYHHSGPEIGLIGEKFYFKTQANNTNNRLHEIYSDNPLENVIEKHPEVAKEMGELCHGIYETTKYMRYHNSPDDVSEQLKK